MIYLTEVLFWVTRYFRRIKLKFGGGVNYETLISYFMSILPNEMNLINRMEFYVISF